MTEYKNISVCCPVCCEESAFRICTTAELCENPELKERIFSRDLFRFVCPECGEEILVSYSCTAIHRDKKLITALISDGEESSAETAARLSVSGYTLRIVRTINEFVEKLALSEDGIDDRIVEMYKIMLEDQFEEERPNANALGIFYGGFDSENNALTFFIITSNAENTRASLSMDAYTAIENQLSQSAADFGEVCEVNRDWAIAALQSRMKNAENENAQNGNTQNDCH